MADKQAISEMLGKGGWAYDTPDVDYLADMFTEDGKFDLTIDGMGQVGSFSGRAEIRKLYEDSLASQTDQRRHVVTNIFFEDETDSSVTAMSYLVLIAVKDGALNVLSSGVYKDSVVLDGDVWRIAHRDLHLDLPY
jgi:SnoaL-like domain